MTLNPGSHKSINLKNSSSDMGVEISDKLTPSFQCKLPPLN